MKNIPIAYQTFIYIIGLVLALFLLIYAASQSIIPSVYFRQSQEKMNQTFEELNDELMQAVDFNSIQNEYNEYILRSPYDIKVYNLKGEALFENIARLSPSILINLNEGYIDDLYYDGYVSYLVRIERFDQYIYKTEVPLDGLYQTISTTNDVLTIVFIISFVLAIFFSYLISKITTNPIKKLIIMSESNNNLLELKRKDEIGQLSKAIDRLRKNLKSTIIKLEQELEREKKQDIVTKNLIANVSHEYQTPLAIINATIETIIDHPNLSKNDLNKHIKNIIEESNHLKNLAKSVSDYSKIYDNNSNVKELDLVEVLNKVIENIKKLYPEKIINLKYETSEVLLSTSESSFKQIFYNIIKNAFDHQTKNDLSIVVKKINRYLRFEFTNSADNLKKMDLAHLFDAFYKVSSKGYGLGLSITKKILDSYGYKYGIEKSDGKFLFYIELNL